MTKRIQKFLRQLLVLTLAVLVPVAPIQAGIVDTGSAISMSERADTLGAINAVLARDDVRQQFVAMGVAPADALARVQALTDEELQVLASDLDNLPAGSGVLGLIGAVIVVLIVLEILGVTNVFTGL